MFSGVKKASKLSLLHKLIKVNYFSKSTSCKTAVECSNPKDDLQVPKCKFFGIIQNPQYYFLVPEDS
jgi:hypothetical protein